MAHFSYTDLRDKVLNWLHGRRLGVIGDSYGSNTSLLVLDGIAVGSSRSGAAPLLSVANGVAAAGPVTIAAAAVGDNVAMVLNLTGDSDDSANFESTVTVAGQIQQSSASNLSANKYLFVFQPQS